MSATGMSAESEERRVRNGAREEGSAGERMRGQ